MPETGAGLRQRGAAGLEREQGAVERELPERHEDPRPRQQRELPLEILAAALDLLGKRPVVRRRAPADGRDESAGKSEAVFRIPGLRLVREPDGVERRKEKVARSVAREDAARAVSPVRGRREADDQDPRGRIAEGGDRFGPVTLTRESPGRTAGRLFAPGI